MKRKILALMTELCMLMSTVAFASAAEGEITFQDETGSISISQDGAFIATVEGKNLEGDAFDLYVIGTADENGSLTITSLTDGQVELLGLASEEQLAGDTATAQALYEKAMAGSQAEDAAPAQESEVDLETVYRMAQKALDQQAIQNVMSRPVMYHCYGLHQEEMEQIWVQEPENQATASFGQNQGFMVGYPAIWEAYVDGHTESWLKSARQYCTKQGIDIEGWSDEQILDLYGGVGQLLMHVTTTGIIEVAEDGQTAKCFWYSPGLVAETGQSGNAIWEAYGVDFVKEDGQWKIWHLHMFTDFTGSFFVDLSKSGQSGGGQGGGQPAPDAGGSQGGQAPEGESPAGESPDGPAPEGGSPEGQAPEGGSPDGQAPAADAAAADNGNQDPPACGQGSPRSVRQRRPARRRRSPTP